MERLGGLFSQSPPTREGDRVRRRAGRVQCPEDAVPSYRVCEAWLSENEDAAGHLAENAYDDH
ncbi:hypothetical protein [Streptomyces sp. NPDC005141]